MNAKNNLLLLKKLKNTEGAQTVAVADGLVAVSNFFFVLGSGGKLAELGTCGIFCYIFSNRKYLFFKNLFPARCLFLHQSHLGSLSPVKLTWLIDKINLTD